MKKLLLILLMLYSSSISYGIHLFGGEITSRHIFNFTYEISVILYRDVNGIPNPTSVTLEIINMDSTVIFNESGTHLPAINICNGIEKYVYLIMVTFPAPDEYGINCWASCCRSDLITNIYFASSQTMTLYQRITVDPSKSLHPAIFLNDPIIIAKIGDTIFYNPLPYDIDGDSLAWSIDTPYSDYYFGSLVYVQGYITPNAFPGGGLTIDPYNGEITWIPNIAGGYTICVLAEEYRNGIKIGEIRRDVGFLVKSIANTEAVTNTNGWPEDWFDNYYFNLPVNSLFNLLISTSDASSGISIQEAIGEPLLIQSNPAIWTNLSQQPGLSEGVFSWTPTIAEERGKPYLQVFRIKELTNSDTLMRDITVQLFVGNATGINDNINNNIKNIYPNPASGELFIPVNVEKSADSKIIIIDNLGQQVKELDQKLNAGQNLIYFDNLKLPAGIYFLNLLINKNESVTKKLVIH